MHARISEIFYSLQMEGGFIGYPAIFIRFAGCNLNCEFCDTKYALSGGKNMSSNEIYGYISKFNTERIIFTGGEPALYDDFMFHFMDRYNKYKFFIETNGTIFPKKSLDYFSHIVVSPKLFSLKENVLIQFKNLAKSIEFKFVINDKSDMEDVERLCDALNLYPVTLQPIFDNTQPVEKYIKKTKMLIEAFKRSSLARKDTRFIMQNHKVIYKEQRGV